MSAELKASIVTRGDCIAVLTDDGAFVITPRLACDNPDNSRTFKALRRRLCAPAPTPPETSKPISVAAHPDPERAQPKRSRRKD
jgi:hypothetical protein